MKQQPQHLFNSDVLVDLEKEQPADEKVAFTTGVSPSNPGANLLLRPLARDDYEKGFLQLLAQLTTVGEYPKEQFEERFEEMRALKDTYYVCVLEDTTTGKIIATGTLVVERKFIRGAAKRGHIEDIVVDSNTRGKQLGKLIIQTLRLLAKRTGCYKVTLDCSTTNVPFYEKCDFSKEDIHLMTKRF
ncbi:glucosamine-6-phosphate N-acetyltransferase [Capsaspora owczarzaki ATCC 30864]|uniref:Glucosamine 6-phosphate N-acetyltransferase n=1 Tax=Capsaspora owczarzaki (strain ATCC 30864) TaxID=595528 RepID=A0A0D2W094_CAPO3|nr:glucosamine-6-phosphate N-acetyltransferase [Capsaspora owczarzaki ATCC 30864]KJE97592.1 glucosamine-6-phosphate N-acetyltransferase [Capsaspora owczarzaki ATCC 30864]|eukprot:XP_004343281.1 glucosamine-6-phosphate N-acetyltransferase [Capsaspora owczarzaki ATCC 30864]